MAKQKLSEVKGRGPRRKYLDVLPEYLKLIKEGKKKAEFRDYADLRLMNSYIPLRNAKTKKLELMIKVGMIYDLDRQFTEEEKEQLYEESYVTVEFREKYDCRYMYIIEEVHTIH